MSDKRRKDHADLDIVQKMIIKILEKKPLQAKLLRKALKNKGREFDFSRDRLNDLLNQLREKGEITRIVIDNNPYPGYAVTNKSKILAEMQGDFFQANFKNNMFLNTKNLLKEFQKETSSIDPLMKFFGFYVLGSLLASHTLDRKDMSDKELKNDKLEELRQTWLKPVLDLQRGNSISDFFDKFFDTHKKDIEKIVIHLSETYKNNMAILEKSVDTSVENNRKIKKIADNNFSKDAIDFINERNKK